jgi:dephospho-CoA kinase
LRTGYPLVESVTADRRFDGAEGLWPKRFHASADPGRPTHIHLRVDGEPNQRFALLFVDWLNANPGVRKDYLDVKRTGDGDAITRWFTDAYPRAWAWAQGTDWAPRDFS